MKLLKYALAALTATALSAQAMTPAEFTQSVIDDMQKPDDGRQLGFDRTSDGGAYAHTQMGMMARGDYAPAFWQPTGPLATWLKQPNWWTAISPWWNAVPLAGNAVTNAQVEIGTISTIGRKKGTQTWYTIFSAESGWAGLYNADTIVYRGVPAEAQGATPGYDSKIYSWVAGDGSNTLHGGGGVFPIDAQSLDGIIHCVAARIVGPNAANAKIAMWSGIDWYPNTTYRYGENGNNPNWGPAVSASRLEKIGTDWTVTCTAPLDNPGRAGGDMHYPADKAGVFMSTAVLKANPVPEMPGLLPAGTVTPPVVEPVEPPPVVEPPCTMPARKAGQKPSTALRVIADTLAACGQ